MNTSILMDDRLIYLENVFSPLDIGLRETSDDDDLIKSVSNILFQLCIPPNIKGYSYLREAIIMKVINPCADMPVTKILYPSIAKRFNTSPSRVERAIRRAIEVAWKRVEHSYAGKTYLFPFFLIDRKPTNSEFIAMVVECMLLQRE